ncbi:MAG TPA: type II toxin-antitoxin system HicB family antitoxin [Blastocatellia bacterium]|jgi:predicted RNase H-like HicB family nuclease
MRYIIALYISEEGYSVSCPGLPGCWSQGVTEEEAIENTAAVEYLIQGAEIREIEVAA